MMAVKSVWWSKSASSSKGKPIKYSSYQLSTGKSVVILGIIATCFAILWPKIFYPMIEVALRPSNKPRSHDNLAMAHPRVRQHIMKDIRHAKSSAANQPFIGLSSRSQIGTMRNKESGGLLNLLMPFYTIGLFVVFLYTILKFMAKDDNVDGYDSVDDQEMIFEESCKNDQPLIKDYQLDPDHRKFVFSEEYDENGENIKRIQRTTNNLRLKRRIKSENKSASYSSSMELIEQDEETSDTKKDEQICELRKRLQVTEDAMDRILKQIGSLNQILEAKGILMDEISSTIKYKDPNEICRNEDENINSKVDKNVDEEHADSGDSNYSSENQDKSTSEYDSDSSITSSKCDSEE